MTSEEAREALSVLKIYDNQWLREAVDMAIEALKAEPIRCGECENYIDRRCIKANHHVAAHGNCMGVFGAKRREQNE